MGAVKQAVLLLLLGAVVSTRAGTPEECEALTKRLPTEEQDQILGHWVLVWSTADLDQQLVGNISSSHVAIRRLDNGTVDFDEENVYLSNTTSCTEYRGNMTIADSDNLLLHSQLIRKNTDGHIHHYNESAKIDVYSSCPDCLLLVYTASRSGRYMLSYRREGHHQDVAEQKTFQDVLNKQAECLKFPKEKPYVYDGVSDFCHKKSAPEAKKEDS